MTFPEDLKLKLRAYITGRSGLYFKDYDLKELEKAATKRMLTLGINSPISYYELITKSTEREAEFRELLNLLTINHTYFFRNEPQFAAFKEKVLPEIIQERLAAAVSQGQGEKPSIRIWSAGCSTGEEPYTIAIILKELIPDIKEWDIEILATDVSGNVLEGAKAGIYGKNSVKPVPKQYLDKYFSEISAGGRETKYRLIEGIREMVRFEYHNMIEDPFLSGFDIIFCRNVVIYFDLPTTKKVMERFYNSLCDGGYIFMGYSETLQYITGKFRMQEWSDAIYYRKISGAQLPDEKTVFSEADTAKRISHALVEAEEKEIRLETRESQAKKASPLIEKAREYILLKQYSPALALAEEAAGIDKDSPEPHILAAEIYANQGDYTRAKASLSDAIKADRLFAPAHYLMGSLYFEEGDIESAKSAFKKALFLDKDLLLPSFALANVHKTEGKTADSMRQYRNTLKSLSKYRADDIIPYSGGFSAAAISSVCRDNLERLKYSL